MFHNLLLIRMLLSEPCQKSVEREPASEKGIRQKRLARQNGWSDFFHFGFIECRLTEEGIQLHRLRSLSFQSSKLPEYQHCFFLMPQVKHIEQFLRFQPPLIQRQLLLRKLLNSYPIPCLFARQLYLDPINERIDLFDYEA